MPAILGRILCFFGLHDFRLVDATFGFGAGGEVTKLQCQRCRRVGLSESSPAPMLGMTDCSTNTAC